MLATVVMVSLAIGSCTSSNAHDPKRLVGEWTLTSYTNSGGEVPASTTSTSTIDFASDGKVVGTSGCNRFGGRYETAGETLKFSAIGMNQMMCADDSVMQQETAFTVAFQKAQTFSVDDRTLTISATDGVTSLRFARD